MVRAGLAFACLVLGAFLKLPEAVEVPGSDTGMFATYGKLVLQGARPYVDFWDLHPPLVYAYWAFVQTLTGPDWTRTCLTINALAPQSCTSLVAHTLDLLLSVAAALVVAAIARRCGGSPAAAAIAGLLTVGFADQVMLSQEGSNPSKLTLLPSTLAVWAYLQSFDSRRPVLSAVCAGAAATVAGLAKQPALLTLAALVLHALWQHDRRRLAAVLIGSCVAGVITCLVLAVSGSLQGFVAEAWLYNLERVFVGYFVNPLKPPTLSLGRVVVESAGVLAVLAVVGACVMARGRLTSSQRMLLAWALLNLVAVTAFREFVYVVPGLSVVAALGLERIWGWPVLELRPIRRSLLLAGCVAAVIMTTSFQRVELARARFERGPGSGPAQVEELGSIIRRELPSGAMFIYGNGAQLYPLADRIPATRYLNAEAWRSTAPGAQHTRAELVGTLRKEPPPVVALAPHSDEAELNLMEFPEMLDFLRDCYAQQPISPDIDASWTVLLRNGFCST